MTVSDELLDAFERAFGYRPSDERPPWNEGREEAMARLACWCGDDDCRVCRRRR